MKKYDFSQIQRVVLQCTAAVSSLKIKKHEIGTVRYEVNSWWTARLAVEVLDRRVQHYLIGTVGGLQEQQRTDAVHDPSG